MQPCCRSNNSPLFASIDGLEALQIFVGCISLHVLRQRSFAQSVEVRLELFVRAIVEESEGTSAIDCIVNNLSHETIVGTKVEFVADTDLTSRVYKYIP